MSLETGIITSEESQETQQEFICKLMKAVQCSVRTVGTVPEQHLPNWISFCWNRSPWKHHRPA